MGTLSKGSGKSRSKQYGNKYPVCYKQYKVHTHKSAVRKCVGARGAAELRIKDHKTYLLSDRMSCSSFFANQFRLFMHSAAYVLIDTLQNEALKGTEYC